MCGGTGLAKQADLAGWDSRVLAARWSGNAHSHFSLPLSIYSDNSLQIPAHTVGGSRGLTAP